MGIFGENLVAVRAFGATCLLIASIVTFEFCRLRTDTATSGAAVAVMIAVAALFQPVMTEYVVIVFLMLAAWFAVAWRGSAWSAFLAGVFISLATLTRTNIGFCAIALGLFYTFELVKLRSAAQLYALLAYVAGGLLPLLMLGLVYWIAGGLDMFVLFAFTLPLNYAETGIGASEALLMHAEAWWKVIADNPVLYGSFTILLVLGLIAAFRRPAVRSESGVSDRAILLLLGGSLLLSIVLGGRAFKHYWIQILPFAAIVIAGALSDRNALWLRGPAYALALASVAAALLRFGPDSITTLRSWPQFETAHVIRQTAELIAADKRGSDQVYALRWHLIYWYLRQSPPSHMVHPSAVVKDEVNRPLIDGGYLDADEFGRILDSRPRYIVKRPGDTTYLDEARGTALNNVLSEHYELWKSSRDIEVYRLR
jgi:hypothetical protein